MHMLVHRYVTPYLSSNCYLLEEGQHGIIIDPCRLLELERTVDEKKLIIDHVLLTHEHADHIMGVSWCREQFGNIVMCSEVCAERLKDPRKNHSYYFELEKSLMGELQKDMSVVVEPFSETADIAFSGEHRLEWMGHELLLHPTPGHSPGSICICVDGICLFTGDTLMDCEKRSTGFVGGSSRDFAEVTLPWLQSLVPDMLVYAGHFEQFRLGDRLRRGEF